MDSKTARAIHELQQKQMQTWSILDKYQETENDELRAFKRLAYQLFGDAQERFDLPTSPTGYRYGGLIEMDPMLPGVVYVGFYVDPPWKRPEIRRRVLLFFGVRVSDVEAQARLAFGDAVMQRGRCVA